MENRVSGQCCGSTTIGGGKPPASYSNYYHSSSSRQVCGDGTDPSPCCGYHACNIFCCNCSDGGCRGRRSARDVNAVQHVEHEHDKNKDGFYEKHEVHNRLLSGACGNYSEKVGKWETEFERMDKDKDGKLSYEEINAKDSFILHGAFSAPCTSAALEESENWKRTQLGVKSSNAVSQQPTPPTTSYPPPCLGFKTNDAS